MSSNRRSRRTPEPQATQQYSAVPQSPRVLMSSRKPVPRLSMRENATSQRPGPSTQPRQQYVPGGRGAMAQSVATGAIGGGYGPYSYTPDPQRDQGVYNNPRFSATAYSDHSSSHEDETAVAHTATVPNYLWDKDPDFDDALHNPDPVKDARLDRGCNPFSSRGWTNVTALVILFLGLIALFAGYPIVIDVRKLQQRLNGFNLGGINGTGQIPDLTGLPRLIDNDTPQEAFHRTGTDGKKYDLVFSDEFNVDGRSFYPGDDPFWEAVDLHYWPTADLEWYDPSAVTTKDGKLVITISEVRNHDLNFMSGMLTSWNKICFMTGYIEVSISMPGTPEAPGFWPAAWTMGNLGRAAYGATTEGMWPYSYDSCDVGTFLNQTDRNGNPSAAQTGGNDNGPLSYLPGQRLSACTCPNSDHPGPSSHGTYTGRGVPEIDIIETQVDVSRFQGQVSQSFQTAPYNLHYNFQNSTPATTIYDDSITSYNNYKGGLFQQAISAVTDIDSADYSGNGYAPYGYEWWSDPHHRDDGYITWFSNGQKTWTLTSQTIGPDSDSQVNQRLVPEEPMYIIFNLGMAPGFQRQDFKHLQFPSSMFIDYVRVYQRSGTQDGFTCDPPSRPTASYINKHMDAYTNPNLTTWAQAGNLFPRNKLYDGC